MPDTVCPVGASVCRGAPVVRRPLSWFQRRAGAVSVYGFSLFFLLEAVGQSLASGRPSHHTFCAWGALFFLFPSTVAGLTSWLFRQQTDSLLVYYRYFAVLLTAFLFALTALLWGLFILRYLPALLLLAMEELLPIPMEDAPPGALETPCLSTRQILCLSVSLMKGRRIQAAALLLSFLPWIVLSAAILPVLWLFPYLLMTTTLYLRYLLFQRDKKKAVRLANRTCEYLPTERIQEKEAPPLSISSDPTIDLS